MVAARCDGNAQKADGAQPFEPIAGFLKGLDGLSQQRFSPVEVTLQQHGLSHHAGWDCQQFFIAQFRGDSQHLFVVANGGGHGTA